MKQNLLAPVMTIFAAFSLGGCVSPYGWSEAPLDDRYYGQSGAPVEWWGRDAESVDVFYGSLAGYGAWANHNRYGRVFLPANVGAGWQPYTRGYWRDDYRGRMWVSAEPWGWATYHYGRWGHDSRLGWFWVPDTRFGPGWVDWRAGNGYASWAPIPPYGWNSWGYGYGDNWWVNAPGYWAYRPGNHGYMRPGRHDWNDHDRPHDGPGDRPPHRPRPDGEPPRARPDTDTVIGNYVRQRLSPRQQVAPQNGGAPDSMVNSRPDRGQGARPPRVEPPRNVAAAQPQRPESSRPESSRPQRPESSRGQPGSGGRETRGRDVSPRTADQ